MKKHFQKWSKITILIIAIILGMPFASSLKIDSVNINNFILSGITLYVGGSGPNNYTAIQDAINDSSDGDNVYVFNGIYYENVIVNKSIDLIGQNMYSTIIDGQKREDFDTVYICADDVTLSGFTIQNSGEEPFNPDCGIDVRSDRVIIIRNKITNNNYGIHFDDYSKDNIVNNNLIHDNDDRGIILGKWVLNTIISNNTIIENEGDGIHCAGGLYEEHHSVISGNQISLNRMGGIAVGKCTHYLISENTIYGNRFYGIDISNNVGNYNILGNKISYNEIGINFQLCNNNSIIGNSITHNYNGIDFLGADNNNISNNDISHNVNIGFFPGYSNGNTIYQNNFVNNSLHCFIIQKKTDENYFNSNYWDRFRVFPKIILGVENRLDWLTWRIFVPQFYFDMNPASEPYDI